MKAQPEILLGRIAVERGWITPERLAECLQEQAAAPLGKAPQLGAILLRKGYLHQAQLDAIVEEQGRRLLDILDLSDPRIEDAFLGRMLVRQGLATEPQVYECLRLQAEMAETGKPPARLGELLVHKNYIASDAMDTAVLMKKREIFVCPSCSTHFSTLGADLGRKYACRKCGCVLEREERLFRPGETTGALRIDMPDDAAAHAKDSDRRLAGGRYILIDEVGRGGMGIVWKAWQPDLRRYVAIKLLAGAGWTDPDLRRFHREAQLAAGLSHSNIASIYEVGVDAGRHFISMEFVEGDPLSHLSTSAPHGARQGTQRRHVGLRHAVEIVREAANAVEYAHSKGLIHRDIKPSNIMVAKQGGRVYVMDFGLARPVRSQESITVSDAIMGTPSYMSPEQARGDPALDRRADVYSLGAVLYAALAGRPPFAGHSPAETLMKVIADDVVAPRELNPRVHADLETICLKALDKDRRRRYDSAKAFAEDLTRHLEGEPISARSLSWRELLWKAIRRRPVAAVGAAGGVLAVTLTVVAILILYGRPSPRVPDPSAVETERDKSRAELRERGEDLERARADAKKARADAEKAEEEAKRARADSETARVQAEKRRQAQLYYEAGLAAWDTAGRLKLKSGFAVADVLRKYREALGSLTRAILEDDGYAEAWFLRGRVRVRTAEYAEAEQDFGSALRRNPLFAEAAIQAAILHVIRVQLYSRVPYVKSPDEVKSARNGQQKAAETALNLSPAAYGRWCAKAILALHARKFEEALDDLDAVRAEGIGEYGFFLLRAVILFENDDDAQALPAFIAALELEPAAFESLFLRALLRDRRDELDEALEDAKNAVEVAPDHYLGYLLRAHVYQRRSDLRHAAADLDQASKLPGAPKEQILEVLAKLRDSSDR